MFEVFNENNVKEVLNKKPIICFYSESGASGPSGLFFVIFEDKTAYGYNDCYSKSDDKLIVEICNHVPELCTLTMNRDSNIHYLRNHFENMTLINLGMGNCAYVDKMMNYEELELNYPEFSKTVESICGTSIHTMYKTVEKVIKENPDIKVIYDSAEKEEKYYQIIHKAIMESPLYPKNQKDEQRLKEEMKMLHERLSSRTIWICYQISLEAKRNNEPYLFCGTAPDLYVLYVLGITKYNPIEYGCCYQACIGLKSRPECFMHIDMRFRKEYLDRIREFVKEINLDCNLYCYSRHIYDDPIPYLPASKILIPKGLDVNYVCHVRKDGDQLIVGPKDNDLFSFFVQITLLESNALENVSGNESPAFLDEKLIHEEAMKYVIHRKKDPSTYIFSTREDIYQYLVDKCGIKEDEAYRIMAITRRGKFEEYYGDSMDEKLPKNVIDDLKNILYLFPKSHIIEMLRVMNRGENKNYE